MTDLAEVLLRSPLTPYTYEGIATGAGTGTQAGADSKGGADSSASSSAVTQPKELRYWNDVVGSGELPLQSSRARWR